MEVEWAKHKLWNLNKDTNLGELCQQKYCLYYVSSSLDYDCVEIGEEFNDLSSSNQLKYYTP